jgi:hypothetical protein
MNTCNPPPPPPPPTIVDWQLCGCPYIKEIQPAQHIYAHFAQYVHVQPHTGQFAKIKESRPKQNFFYNFLGHFSKKSSTHSGLDCVKSSARNISCLGSFKKCFSTQVERISHRPPSSFAARRRGMKKERKTVEKITGKEGPGLM